MLVLFCNNSENSVDWMVFKWCPNLSKRRKKKYYLDLLSSFLQLTMIKPIRDQMIDLKNYTILTHEKISGSESVRVQRFDILHFTHSELVFKFYSTRLRMVSR